MNIASLSMALSNSKVQNAASLAVMKIAMNRNKENSMQMTEMLKTAAVDPNKGKHLDIIV